MRLFFAMACFLTPATFGVGALLGADLAQGVLGDRVGCLVDILDRLGELGLDGVHQRLDPVLGDDPVLLQVCLEPRDGVQLPGLLHFILGSVGAVVVVGGMGSVAVGLGLGGGGAPT